MLTAATCGRLFNPLNGTVNVTGFTVGSEAVYNCDEMFTLVGSANRTCEEDGIWSPGPPPYCTQRIIGKPAIGSGYQRTYR